MKKFFAILILLFFIGLDFFSDKFNIIFFPKEDLKDFLEIKKEVETSIKDNKLIIDNIALNNCNIFSKENRKIITKNLQEQQAVEDFEKKCKLNQIMQHATVALHKKLIKNIYLSDFGKWSSELVLSENCEENYENINIYSYKYKTMISLINEGLILVNTVNKNHIIVDNTTNNKIYEIKEITRCGFKNDTYNNIVVEIKISNKKTSKTECTIYKKYSSYREGEFLNRKY